MIVKMQKIVRLQQHVAELGKGDPIFAIEAHLHGILADHVIHGEMFPDVAQKIDQIQREEPIGIVHHAGRIVFHLEIEKMRELLFDRLKIGFDGLARKQLSLRGFSARVADHARAALRLPG